MKMAALPGGHCDSPNSRCNEGALCQPQIISVVLLRQAKTSTQANGGSCAKIGQVSI
jgi:hypothetical protein